MTAEEFRAFTAQHILPHAGEWDRQEHLPRALIENLAGAGYLAPFLPSELGGQGLDMVTVGRLHEEIGRGCSSTRSLLTVHGMVCRALQRWGGKLKSGWLPRLARGEVLAAFALTEPEVGSDAASVATRAERQDEWFVINGAKQWISFAQIADVFLVMAAGERGPVALLVERDTPGLRVTPQSGILGASASMLGALRLQDCRVPAANLVGAPGWGVSAVALTALDLGRYSVAWGCVGILRACLEASLAYAAQRRQFGAYLREHQLVAAMLTDMSVDCQAARALCLEAGRAWDAGDAQVTRRILAAKYFASRAATQAALNAVQIHGAHGCGPDAPVGRYLRDAKVMEIIEGSNQMQQLLIAQLEYQDFPTQ